ncbi:MAG: M50 family metallopeptidase [Lachnospiraceae bacterium]|nr:M50 family metallopeptidase [Lachnospiraceae bacterium]
MSIIFSLLILCLVVVVHEFGHLLVAKKNGINVKEFWVGFGPKICSFDAGGTKYCLRIIPLGGACVFEDDTSDEDYVPGPHAFMNASVFSRILTVLAGPCFNFLLAFVLSVVVLGLSGYTTTKLESVNEGSPAMKAGLQAGDVIIKMNSERVHLYEEIILNTQFNQGEPVAITYERNGERHTVDITPEYSEEYGRYLFGIVGGLRDDDQTALSTVRYSVYYVEFWIKNVYKSLAALFTGRVRMNEMSGVVGVAAAVDDVYEEAKDYGALVVFINMLNIAVLLSANLGVVNLLPIPGLDGGKLLLYLVEIVRRKPMDRELEGKISLVGFAALMILAVFLMYSDIVKIFTK